MVPIDFTYILQDYFNETSHNTSVIYPTMHHFVTEMCTFLLQSGALWDMGWMHWEICDMEHFASLTINYGISNTNVLDITWFTTKAMNCKITTLVGNLSHFFFKIHDCVTQSLDCI